jgi:hypothetical protein
VRNFFCIILILAGNSVLAADDVPRCWVADQPSADIQDGLFRVMLPTDGSSAHDVADLMVLLSRSLAGQVGAGALSDLTQIEIDMYGETKYWQPTQSFPTLESFKNAIVSSLAPVLALHAVIQCAPVNHHTHD